MITKTHAGRDRSIGARDRTGDGMTPVRRGLLALALFQSASTLVGCVELLIVPQWYAATLDGTAFAGRYGVAAALLGVVVGGFPWVAAVLQWRGGRWATAAHTLAGLVMLGWIAGECLVLGTFSWPHALWGGAGALQLLLVCVLLGAFRPGAGAADMPGMPRRS